MSFNLQQAPAPVIKDLESIEAPTILQPLAQEIEASVERTGHATWFGYIGTYNALISINKSGRDIAVSTISIRPRSAPPQGLISTILFEEQQDKSLVRVGDYSFLKMPDIAYISINKRNDPERKNTLLSQQFAAGFKNPVVEIVPHSAQSVRTEDCPLVRTSLQSLIAKSLEEEPMDEFGREEQFEGKTPKPTHVCLSTPSYDGFKKETVESSIEIINKAASLCKEHFHKSEISQRTGYRSILDDEQIIAFTTEVNSNLAQRISDTRTAFFEVEEV